MDKKIEITIKKNSLVHFRGWIQAAATLLTNIHIPNLFKGKIYQGKAKTVCVPGLELLFLSRCNRCMSDRCFSGGRRFIQI